MKLTYFGTAAYEGFPALGCQCPACMRARQAGGKNLRSRTQALVGDDLLLDFPADSVWHFMRYNIDYARIKACLITHSHSDHLYTGDIRALGEYYTQNARTEPLRFYAGESGYCAIEAELTLEHVRKRVACTRITPFEEFFAAGYSVLPIEANHNADTSPVVYRIEKDGKSLLFAHDTGVFPKRSWEALENAGRVDLVSLDATRAIGAGKKDRHLGFDLLLEVAEEMKRRGIADDKTVIVANHFSHHCQRTYDDMLPLGERYGVLISYDGMEIEF